MSNPQDVSIKEADPQSVQVPTLSTVSSASAALQGFAVSFFIALFSSYPVTEFFYSFSGASDPGLGGAIFMIFIGIVVVLTGTPTIAYFLLKFQKATSDQLWYMKTAALVIWTLVVIYFGIALVSQWRK